MGRGGRGEKTLELAVGHTETRTRHTWRHMPDRDQNREKVRDGPSSSAARVTEPARRMPSHVARPSPAAPPAAPQLQCVPRAQHRAGPSAAWWHSMRCPVRWLGALRVRVGGCEACRDAVNECAVCNSPEQHLTHIHIHIHTHIHTHIYTYTHIHTTNASTHLMSHPAVPDTALSIHHTHWQGTLATHFSPVIFLATVQSQCPSHLGETIGRCVELSGSASHWLRQIEMLRTPLNKNKYVKTRKAHKLLKTALWWKKKILFGTAGVCSC